MVQLSLDWTTRTSYVTLPRQTPPRLKRTTRSFRDSVLLRLGRESDVLRITSTTASVTTRPTIRLGRESDVLHITSTTASVTTRPTIRLGLRFPRRLLFIVSRLHRH